MGTGAALVTVTMLKFGVFGGVVIAITTASEFFHGYKRKPKKGVKKNDGDDIEALRKAAEELR